MTKITDWAKSKIAEAEWEATLEERKMHGLYLYDMSRVYANASAKIERVFGDVDYRFVDYDAGSSMAFVELYPGVIVGIHIFDYRLRDVKGRVVEEIDIARKIVAELEASND